MAVCIHNCCYHHRNTHFCIHKTHTHQFLYHYCMINNHATLAHCKSHSCHGISYKWYPTLLYYHSSRLTGIGIGLSLLIFVWFASLNCRKWGICLTVSMSYNHTDMAYMYLNIGLSNVFLRMCIRLWMGLSPLALGYRIFSSKLHLTSQLGSSFLGKYLHRICYHKLVGYFNNHYRYISFSSPVRCRWKKFSNILYWFAHRNMIG